MTAETGASAHEIAQAVASGKASAANILEAHLSRIAAENPRINAFTDLTAARARAEAARIDAARGAAGPLAGVPFAVKNLFDIAGLPTRAGSLINRDAAPAGADAVLIRRLNAAGAVLLGGLNMGEFAYDFTGENAHDGACRNPHDPARMSGGSSSGSGAAVAAGLAAFSLGSDTNGSIRVPASFCGIFGLKPTYGRLPRTGSFPFCDSLDHVGPLARSTRDLALAHDAMQGHDAGDAACSPRPADPVTGRLGAGLAGLRIAMAGGYFDTSGLGEADAALQMVARGLDVRETITLEGAAEARGAAFLITNAESSAFHLPRLRARAQDYDPDTCDRFLAGALLPAAWLVRAQMVRRWFAERMARIFEEVDVILAPATPCVAPEIGQTLLEFRGQTLPLRPNLGMFTQPVSAIGLPAVSVPVWPEGSALPIGVQVIAAPWREDLCLRVALALEEKGIARTAPR